MHTERSHSGLVRRFAKPLKGKLFRGFDSRPLRLRVLVYAKTCEL